MMRSRFIVFYSFKFERRFRSFVGSTFISHFPLIFALKQISLLSADNINQKTIIALSICFYLSFLEWIKKNFIFSAHTLKNRKIEKNVVIKIVKLAQLRHRNRVIHRHVDDSSLVSVLSVDSVSYACDRLKIAQFPYQKVICNFDTIQKKHSKSKSKFIFHHYKIFLLSLSLFFLSFSLCFFSIIIVMWNTHFNYFHDLMMNVINFCPLVTLIFSSFSLKMLLFCVNLQPKQKCKKKCVNRTKCCCVWCLYERKKDFLVFFPHLLCKNSMFSTLFSIWVRNCICFDVF